MTHDRTNYPADAALRTAPPAVLPKEAPVLTNTDPSSAAARAVGIVNGEWPYGPNIDPQARRELVHWATLHGLRYSPRGRCLHWIIRGRCAIQLCTADRNQYDFMDHVTGWTRDGKPAVLICQPYGLHVDDIRQLADLHQEHGLKIRIDGTGWYGHGSTFLQLWRREVCA